MLRRILATTALSSLVLWSPPSTAAVPNLLTEQGRLYDQMNNPLSATVTMGFSIYSVPTGGPALWSETQPVTAADGYFSAELGTVTPLPPAVFTGQSLYLGLTVGSDAEMTPRQPMTTVPYAFTADNAIADITPTSVSIQTAATPASVMPVIDSTGTWQGQPIPVGAVHNGIISAGTLSQSSVLTVPPGGNPAQIGGLSENLSAQKGDIFLFTFSGQFLDQDPSIVAMAYVYVTDASGKTSKISSTGMSAIYMSTDVPAIPAQSTTGIFAATVAGAVTISAQANWIGGGITGLSFGTGNSPGSLTIIQIRP
jgi:hypothetical protein